MAQSVELSMHFNARKRLNLKSRNILKNHIHKHTHKDKQTNKKTDRQILELNDFLKKVLKK